MTDKESPADSVPGGPLEATAQEDPAAAPAAAAKDASQAGPPAGPRTRFDREFESRFGPKVKVPSWTKEEPAGQPAARPRFRRGAAARPPAPTRDEAPAAAEAGKRTAPGPTPPSPAGSGTPAAPPAVSGSDGPKPPSPPAAAPLQFRESAMAAAAAPGQLDLGVRIVRTPHWILLFVVLLLILAAIEFSFSIQVPTMVKAQGILIPEEGLKDIESLTIGRVKSIMVKPGDFVREGMRVAEVEQPDLSQKLVETQDALVNSRLKFQHVKEFQGRIKQGDEGMREQEIKILTHLIASNEEHVGWLQKNVDSFQSLLAKGFISNQEMIEARVKLHNTQAELIQNRNKLNSLIFQAESRTVQFERELLDLAMQVEEARRAVHSIRERRLRLGFVTSPYTGVVVEQKADLGAMVNQGQTLLSVLPGEKAKGRTKLRVGLLATLYLPAAEGKQVEPGMEVHIVPSTVKREEYGFIIGKIISVSAIPASSEGMMRVLKNKQLVEGLSKQGAPLQARAELELDEANFSGFRWSSPDGPEQNITAGSMCSAEVVVKKQPLAALVMPSIKRMLQMFTN